MATATTPTTGGNSPLQEQWMVANDSGDLETVRALLAAHPELLNVRVDHPVRPFAALAGRTLP